MGSILCGFNPTVTGKIHNMEQLDNFGNIQYLKLDSISHDVALSLIKCNKDTITELILIGVNFTDSDNVGMHIPKLRHLELEFISGDVALSLIKCNKDTITELRLYHIDTIVYDTFFPVVEMPRLKHFCLASLKMKMELKLDY